MAENTNRDLQAVELKKIRLLLEDLFYLIAVIEKRNNQNGTSPFQLTALDVKRIKERIDKIDKGHE